MYIPWLKNLNEILSDETLNESINNFHSASTDKCRIDYILKLFHKYQLPPFFNHPDKVKNRIDSEKFKNEGNRIFLSKRDAKEYLKVLELYNKCIAFAPNNSTELALGFANRSAVLFHFQKYSEAVQDIDRAFNLNYPANLKHKLLIRKTECLALLGSSNFEEVYEETVKWINDMSLDASSKEILKNKLDSVREATPEKIEENLDQDVPVIVPQNKIPCATEAVDLRHNKKFGRHLVATREINPGEVLVVEKPYATALHTGKFHTHCSRCLKFVWTSIPCDKCVYVLYCSENCKDQAWKEYHDVECPVTGDLLNAEMNNHFFLCMRLLIMAVKEFGSIDKLKEELIKIDASKTDPRTNGFSEDGKLHGNTFKSIYRFDVHTEKRPFDQLFPMTCNSAVILISMAVRSNFFNETFKKDVFAALSANEDVLFAGGLILRNIQIVGSNSYEYVEQRRAWNEDCGTAIMPFLNFINHDCNPNVYRLLAKGRMVLYALCPIKKDTQLFTCYAGTYTNTAREYRQSTIARHFFFTCKCTACERYWPELSLPYDINLIRSCVTRKRLEAVVNKLYDYYHSELCAEKPSDRLKYMRSNPNTFEEVQNIISVLVHSLPVNSAQVVCAISTLKHILDAFGDIFEVPELKKV